MDIITFPTKAARLAYVREKLGSSKAWALRALCVIHEGQTSQEQTCERTTELNGVGFTAFDAEILTSLAKQVARHNANPVYPTPLSEKQMALLFKRIPKYAQQVLDRTTLAATLVTA